MACPGKHGKIESAKKLGKVTFPLLLSQSETIFKAAIMINWTQYNNCLNIFNISLKMQKIGIQIMSERQREYYTFSEFVAMWTADAFPISKTK